MSKLIERTALSIWVISVFFSLHGRDPFPSALFARP
ncbi:hypothetical protein CHUV2995_02902 [Corynebacterium diphtheriae subsp. lausannense]|nr:hypothetical protein CHUV2995_02902 [Corynebacterium diphtheriae subsp. lausannense]